MATKRTKSEMTRNIRGTISNSPIDAEKEAGVNMATATTISTIAVTLDKMTDSTENVFRDILDALKEIPTSLKGVEQQNSDVMKKITAAILHLDEELKKTNDPKKQEKLIEAIERLKTEGQAAFEKTPKGKPPGPTSIKEVIASMFGITPESKKAAGGSSFGAFKSAFIADAKAKIGISTPDTNAPGSFEDVLKTERNQVKQNKDIDALSVQSDAGSARAEKIRDRDKVDPGKKEALDATQTEYLKTQGYDDAMLTKIAAAKASQSSGSDTAKLKELDENTDELEEDSEDLLAKLNEVDENTDQLEELSESDDTGIIDTIAQLAGTALGVGEVAVAGEVAAVGGTATAATTGSAAVGALALGGLGAAAIYASGDLSKGERDAAANAKLERAGDAKAKKLGFANMAEMKAATAATNKAATPAVATAELAPGPTAAAPVDEAAEAATPAVATPAVATPAVATPAVATPAVATPAVATATSSDSVATASSRDMQLSINKAKADLARKGIEQPSGHRQDVKTNADGTYTATVDYRKPPAVATAELAPSPAEAARAAALGTASISATDSASGRVPAQEAIEQQSALSSAASAAPTIINNSTTDNSVKSSGSGGGEKSSGGATITLRDVHNSYMRFQEKRMARVM